MQIRGIDMDLFYKKMEDLLETERVLLIDYQVRLHEIFDTALEAHDFLDAEQDPVIKSLTSKLMDVRVEMDLVKLNADNY